MPNATPTSTLKTSTARITADEERALVVRAQGGDRSAADSLARAHLPYMRQEARRFAQRRRLDKADLLSACFVGFMATLAAFDPGRGTRFLTYARHWFRHYMQAVADADNLFGRGPSGSEERAIDAIRRGVVDPDEIARLTGVRRRTAQTAAIVYGARRVSLDRRLVGQDGDEGSLHDVLAASDGTAEELVIALEDGAALRAALEDGFAKLKPRERVVVDETILADEPRSLADVGRQFGVSREMARQIGGRAKTKLRDAIQRRLNERMVQEARAA